MYQYFKNVGFLKTFVVFVLAQIAGSALAVLVVEALPGLKGKSDAAFEILRGGPSLLLILWFVYDMRQKHVDIIGDFKRIPEQIAITDMAAIVVFNILAGIFSVYALIYGVVTFFPPEKLTEFAGANGANATTSMIGVLLASVVAVLLAPPAEELIFRGFLPAQIQKIMPVWVSFVISSFLFAAIHFSASAITTFVFALTLCVVVYKTQNLAITIVLHMLNNLFVSVTQIIGQFSSHEKSLDMTGISQQFMYVALPCLLGSIAIAYYLVKERDFFNLRTGFLAKRP